MHKTYVKDKDALAYSKSSGLGQVHADVCGYPLAEFADPAARVFLCDGNPSFHTGSAFGAFTFDKGVGYSNVGYIDGHARMVTYTSLRDYLLKVWTSRSAQ